MAIAASFLMPSAYHLVLVYVSIALMFFLVWKKGIGVISYVNYILVRFCRFVL